MPPHLLSPFLPLPTAICTDRPIPTFFSRRGHQTVGIVSLNFSPTPTSPIASHPHPHVDYLNRIVLIPRPRKDRLLSSSPVHISLPVSPFRSPLESLPQWLRPPPPPRPLPLTTRPLLPLVLPSPMRMPSRLISPRPRRTTRSQWIVS